MSDTILVTGAAGFIGFHTALRLLEQGQAVVGIDNLNDYYDVSLKHARLERLAGFKNFTFVKCDIADRAGMEALWDAHGPFRKVVHLAAQAGVRYSLIDPYAYIGSNCLGHLTILEMCRRTEGFLHLVYASSSSVYGGSETLPFSTEDRADRPLSLYAATKRSGEMMSYSYAHLYKIPQTGLRFFTVYGPWGRPDMALFIFTKAIAEGAKLPVFGNGKMKRDFTYIDDVVAGVLAALENPPCGTENTPPHRLFNLGNTKSEDLMDFIRLIEQALGKKADIDLQDMQAGDVRETFADIETARTALGYNPRTSIAEGIPQFVDWYKDFYGL